MSDNDALLLWDSAVAVHSRFVPAITTQVAILKCADLRLRIHHNNVRNAFAGA